VDCDKARDLLLEAADGELPDAVRRSLQTHLAVCNACRTTFEQTEKAVAALRQAASELAHEQPHLTPQRRKRLLVAYEQRQAEHFQEAKLFRLVTYRRFVAAAAAAAILVSAGFIASSLVRMARPVEQEPVIAGGPVPAGYVPVVMAASGQGEPVSIIRRIAVAGEAWPLGDEPAGGARLVRSDSAGVMVPVDHAFYDPEESSHWW
jgi:hypothetical protein